MSVDQPSNETRISGYLDMLLVDNSVWDEKLSLAINPPIYPQDTIAPGCHLLTTEAFGSGNRTIKYMHFLNGICIINQLPPSNLKLTIVQRCLPLAAEAMCFD